MHILNVILLPIYVQLSYVRHPEVWVDTTIKRRFRELVTTSFATGQARST